MSFKIIVDSCGELTEAMKESGLFSTASLRIDIDGYEVVDDETFDQADFLKRVSDSPNCPKSSCPSPEEYMQLFLGEEENVYVVTLSAELSGSYNSAELGRKLFLEEKEAKNIYVFNSRSASGGEALIGLKIKECEEAGMEFSEVVSCVEDYISKQHTYFVLESLETLRKNGRLTGLKSMLATALNIKPVMGADQDGNIIQLSQARGLKKALTKLVDYVSDELVDGETKILAISHCNCRERAEHVKSLLEKKVNVKEIIINDTRGISSLYANDGGIIITV